MSFVERILLSFFQSGCFLFHFLAQLSWRNSSTMFNKCCERGHTFLVIDLRGNHLVCVCMLRHLVISDSLQPLDCSLPVSSVHEISQARILEWVAISSSMGSSRTKVKPESSALAGRFFTTELPGKLHYLILGWPKSSFGIFHNILQKNPTKFLANPIFYW